MGVMLSVLCSYMGAIELVFIVRDVTHQLALHQMRSRNGEEQSDISVLQNRIRASISALETVDTESVEQMQDGVSYQNGYRIENERSVQEAAQQWDERRKAMCVAEVNVTLDSQHKSTVSQANGIQNERTKNLNDEPNEQNNYRPIVRDDRTGRRKAFKKRNSSSSSSDSIRLSREEELKMFTSLEEEEYRNSSFTPISYSNASPANSQKIADPPFHEKQKFDAEAWGNRKPSNYHDSALWKRERATSIVEESEDISHSPLPNSSSKRPVGTADKPSSKTSHEKLIFSGEYTKAMEKDWHSSHFCCWQCDESLTGQRYVLRDDHPYCIKCYENVFANTCEECNKIIGIDSKDLSYKEKHWHEACFLCNKCRVSLVDKQFGSKADKIYCGNCYDSQFASRCDGCSEIFRAGTKKMEYKTRQWHEKCFSCCVCKTPIGTRSFIPREQEIYCSGCYEEKYATRCIKCNLIITSGGVTYKNEPWHRECFTCTNCTTSLAGQRFTSRDEKPYCAECFGELFAKRCTSCTKPITGIGGTRFISFEDRHWHNDCFICASCKTTLVGRGFITDGADIICPECAKQKLM
ncbi:leupaxin isoform X5 [Bradysia coprophila]|uniref:leupaxin isoform X5 n=1 Tax=Bradysia coprophila TaxID=38358 RepID=UPI00187DBEE3|nr:leupaxin isoform X5 [Bradysia coprophila]